MKVKVLKTFSDMRLNGGKRIPASIQIEGANGVKVYEPNILDVTLTNQETATKTREAVNWLIKEGFLEEVKTKRRSS